MMIEEPSKVVFSEMDGFVVVFDGLWNRVDKEKPLKWKDSGSEYGGTITLEDIANQYDEYEMLVVVSETYLHGEIYRYGNYSDCEWCKIGELVGFA